MNKTDLVNLTSGGVTHEPDNIEQDSNNGNIQVLFIVAPAFTLEDLTGINQKDNRVYFDIPNGVLSIEAYVKKNMERNCDIRILDLNVFLYNEGRNGISIENEIQSQITKINPDIVGISANLDMTFSYLHLISESVKRTNPRIITILGGFLGTNLYKDILETHNSIDYICFGEGEIPFLNLINSENFENYLKHSNSFISRKSLQENRIPEHIYVQNLDDIPLYDFDLVAYDEYSKVNALVIEDKDIVLSKKAIIFNLHASRGCPHRCCFCATTAVHGNKMRYMSVERIVEDIQKMVNKYSINVVNFQDDNFLVNKVWAKSILNAIISERIPGIEVEFTSGLASYGIDNELVIIMEKLKMRHIRISLESGSEYVLKEIIGKPFDHDVVKNAVNILHDRDFFVQTNVLLGFPGESKQHREESLKFVKDMCFDWVTFIIATPITGSRLYDDCLANGYLAAKDFSKFSFKHGNIKTDKFSPQEIEDESYLFNLDVNFVNNHNIKSGNYEKVLGKFLHINEQYPKHAFCHYSLKQIYEGLKEYDKMTFHNNMFLEIIDNDPFWKDYAQYFELV